MVGRVVLIRFAIVVVACRSDRKYVSINCYRWVSAGILLWLRVEIAVVDIIGL